MQNRTGEIIREYQLMELAGKGAFAAVYRAEHSLLEQNRAVKIIHPQHAQNPDSFKRFREEAQVVARLAHPHIVTLHEFWVDDRGAYIIMEWMPNKTLEHQLESNGTFPPQDVLRILSQIAPALSLVHTKEIVHRDLKPANILFDEHNNAKLADFGLAKWLPRPPASDSAAGMGTPAYMAPEQGDESITVSGQADLYSLGIILYELLVGKHPFHDATGIVDILIRHQRDPLPLMRDANPTLPSELDDVIQKATAKDPKKRHVNALELAEDFRQAIHSPIKSVFLDKTSTLESVVIEPRGELNASVYEKSGAVLENPRRLIGRNALVRMVSELFVESPHILLHGLAGIGKTAIAGRIAAQYLEMNQGKVIWIELGRQNADALFEAVARALAKYPDIAGTQGKERVALIRNMLLEEEALLVIDNVWNEQAVLPIIQAVPQFMPMLMTSRIAVSIDGKMLDIDSLAKEDALELLSYHANHDYFEDENAYELCDMLGNHPYAIEMAGKRLQMYRYLNPQKLMDDIQSASSSGVETGLLGIPQQHSVKDLLDESVDELDDGLRDMLITMGGLFSTRSSLDLLAKVAIKDVREIEGTLGELERNGLLRLVMDDSLPSHYRLHDLTYSYAHALFEQQQNGHVIDGVRQFMGERVQDYDALEFDIMNILGAARAAYHANDDEGLIAIMRYLVVDANYLTARGPSSAAMELLEAAIEAAKRCEDYEAVHYLTGKLGNVYFQITSQFKLAVEAYTEAYDYAVKIGDLGRQAILLSMVATSRFKAGMDEVEDYYERASQIAQKSKDIRIVAQILSNQSFHANEKSSPDYRASLKFCEQAIKIATTHDLYDHLFASIINKAKSEYHLGLLKESMNTNSQAYNLACKLNNDNWIMTASTAMAWSCHSTGNRKEAAEYYREAFTLAKKIGNTAMINTIEEQADNFGYNLL